MLLLLLNCRDMQASPYTMTKDSFFVLDKLPAHPEVSMFTGGNGRAFKFAPLIGRYALASMGAHRIFLH